MQRFNSMSEILSKNNKDKNPLIMSLLTLLHTMILNFVITLEDFSSCFRFVLHSLSHFFPMISPIPKEGAIMKDSKPSIHNKAAECGTALKSRDIEVVMGALGMHWDCDEDQEVEVCNVFDKNEPTVGELKKAFDMFDSDKDGCIDAKDLKKMLCCLGFEKFSEWDCLKMIFALSNDHCDSIESSSGIGYENFAKILDGRVS